MLVRFRKGKDYKMGCPPPTGATSERGITGGRRLYRHCPDVKVPVWLAPQYAKEFLILQEWDSPYFALPFRDFLFLVLRTNAPLVCSLLV